MQNMSLPNLGQSDIWSYLNDPDMAQRLSYPYVDSHSRKSSSQSTTADSSPASFTFSSRGRSSGSNSSLSSTPPHNDQPDFAAAISRKAIPALPGVAEDPMERDVFTTRAAFPLSLQNSPVASRRDSGEYSWIRPSSLIAARYDYDRGDFLYHHDDRFSKRRKSGDSTLNSFANRLVDRFPSISRRQRKRASMVSEQTQVDRSSPFLSRSSSYKRSPHSRSQEVVGNSSEPHLIPSPIETIVEDENNDVFAPVPMDISYEEPVQKETLETPVRSSTPLLPPLMSNMLESEPFQSPLISPTVAAPSKPSSGTATPLASPILSHPESPTLSSQPSNSSFSRSRATTLVSSASEIPPLVIADAEDEWANKLGHANFSIYPEPYLPEYCDLDSCKQLRDDWETARGDFAKHLARTEAHFGANSKTFKRTKEKWAVIDVEWKRNSEMAARRAAESGATPFPIIPIEPAPVPQIPIIDDARLLSGDDMNIVGPMTQIKPQIQRKPSRRAQFMKLFGISG